MDRLDAMRVFCPGGGDGEVSRLSPAGWAWASRRSANRSRRWRDHLGAQLIRRSSRGINLTEAGKDFYDSTVRLLGDLDVAESRIGHRQATASGLLRVALSAGFGRMHVVPLLPAFLARYPEVMLDFRISDRFVDLIEDGIDLAIRIGELADSTLVGRRIAATPLIAVATARLSQAAWRAAHAGRVGRPCRYRLLGAGRAGHPGISAARRGAPACSLNR